MRHLQNTRRKSLKYFQKDIGRAS